MTLSYDDPGEISDIQVSEMREGQVGMITAWPHGRYVGDVVKNVCDHLFGITNDVSWDEIPKNKDCRVRILLNGTTLTVVDNEEEN